MDFLGEASLKILREADLYDSLTWTSDLECFNHPGPVSRCNRPRLYTIDETMTSTQQKPRVLIGKPGLDGHDRGAKYVAHILRDAGFEVIYTGIRRSPEQIVEAAIQEDVAAIGLSLLSGAHNVLFKRVLDLLKERGADDIVVFGGGTIPPEDVTGLREAGVSAVFTPGTSAETIIDTLNDLLSARA